ncbi:MAG: c-type cytochrome [Gemmatimonadota bacterium]
MRIKRGVRAVGYLGSVTVLACAGSTPAVAQEFENLQVLPQDISRQELIEVMLGNLRGLGLPRRASRGCLFCHAGSMDVPSSEWDWASDENPMKRKARVMMAMVQEINGSFLSALPTRSNPDLEVTCYTCHAARTNPTPLPDLLIAEFERGGVDRLVEAYRDVRARYYEADAYDFRPRVLLNVADRLSAMGHGDASVAVHRLNVEVTDDPVARGGLIRLRLVQALESDGIDSMVTRYYQLRDEHPPQAFRPLLLSSLAGRLFRAESQDAGLRLFELNLSEHPDAFVATEDLAWTLQRLGDHLRALELAERWVEGNPDHQSGLRLLADLSEAGG